MPRKQSLPPPSQPAAISHSRRLSSQYPQPSHSYHQSSHTRPSAHTHLHGAFHRFIVQAGQIISVAALASIQTPGRSISVVDSRRRRWSITSGLCLRSSSTNSGGALDFGLYAMKSPSTVSVMPSSFAFRKTVSAAATYTSPFSSSFLSSAYRVEVPEERILAPSLSSRLRIASSSTSSSHVW